MADPLTGADLLTYVGGSAGDTTYAEGCVAEATELVDQLAGDAEIPDATLRRAYLECASELFHRKQAPNGIAQFATPDGANPVRIARDPLTGVYPLLSRFIGGGFA